MIIEIIGWIYSICFIICGIPMLYQCYKQKNGIGISKLFLWLWLIGEITLMIYAYLKFGIDYPIHVNAIFCTIIVLMIMKYVYFPAIRINGKEEYDENYLHRIG